MRKTNFEAENYSKSEIDHIDASKKKPAYAVSKEFAAYLTEYGREEKIPINRNSFVFYDSFYMLHSSEYNYPQ